MDVEEIKEDVKRFTRSVFFFALMAALIISAVLAAYMWHYYEQTTIEAEYERALREMLEQKIEMAAKYVAVGPIMLTFSPYRDKIEVKGTAITFLLGFVGVSKLRNVVARPIIVRVTFTPEIEAPEYGTVRYDYTDVISLEVAPPELDEFMLPWGAFPVELSGFKPGDQISWRMRIEAVVFWMDTEVTRVVLPVTYALTVV